MEGPAFRNRKVDVFCLLRTTGKKTKKNFVFSSIVATCLRNLLFCLFMCRCVRVCVIIISVCARAARVHLSCIFFPWMGTAAAELEDMIGGSLCQFTVV